MMYQVQLPKVVKWILMVMGGLTLLSTLVPKFFGIISPTQLFGLSTWGLKHGFIWQLLTFGFIYPPGTELGFGLLISLFFTLYILYFVGISLVATHGVKDFSKLFFGGMLVSGTMVALAQWLGHSPFVFCSTSTATFLLLTAWMMLDPERQILLFMTIPLKIKWLVAIFFGGQIVIEFANGDFISCVGHLTPCLFSWMFVLFKWDIKSPFPALHRLENFLYQFKSKMKHEYPDIVDAKVYDFQTGRAILDDESFMDVCLAKIAKYGKKSLSLAERFRMRRISKRRRRQS